MRFILRHWYNMGIVVGVVSITWAFFGHLSTVQSILLLNFAVLTLHQFEEYAWPGGEPWITNEVMQPNGNRPDRYPLNQNNAFFINVPMAWPFYLIPVFFPDVVWLGLAPTLFGFGQLIFHGILTTVKLKKPYNPGLAAVVVGHVPLGIWYLVVIYSKNMITPRDWVFGIVYLGCFIAVGVKMIGYTLLSDKDSKYPFAPEEMERWDREGHLARIGNTVPTSPIEPQN
jgi:hypothetical protein